jgi:SAM-dependent methyltransferase
MTLACRFCTAPLEVTFADLGMSPLANSYLPPQRANGMEPFYPLEAFVCSRCFLVQLGEFESPDRIFSDYAYFSSYSSSWLEHARRYAEAMAERFALGSGSHVVEIASNDGYLLQYFKARGIPVLGIEPAANTALAALEKGIPTLVEFFGTDLARRLEGERRADLLIGNNVLAHVPRLNDFVAGMKILLDDRGVITMEFPHLMRLIEDNQWDTIYHEHFSYFSFSTARHVFAAHGLRLFDVEELPTHGGSLRIYGCHDSDPGKPDTDRTRELLAREDAAGYSDLATYVAYGRRIEEDKREIVAFLTDLKRRGKRIVGYGAPAKGNTLLNYCGIRRDFLDYTVDLSPHKQGHLLPGTHIPIRAPGVIREDHPDVVFILPWNLKDEIVEQLAYIREWDGAFAVRAPELELIR